MAFGLIQKSSNGTTQLTIDDTTYLVIGNLFKGATINSVTASFAGPSDLTLQVLPTAYDIPHPNPTFPSIATAYNTSTGLHSVTSTGGTLSINILILGK